MGSSWVLLLPWGSPTFGLESEMAKQYKPRNYEFRSIPGVAPNLKVSRDGDVQINGKDIRDINLMGIRKHDGTRISIQMAIHLAFPDIPMRETPTR